MVHKKKNVNIPTYTMEYINRVTGFFKWTKDVVNNKLKKRTNPSLRRSRSIYNLQKLFSKATLTNIPNAYKKRSQQRRSYFVNTRTAVHIEKDPMIFLVMQEYGICEFRVIDYIVAAGVVGTSLYVVNMEMFVRGISNGKHHYIANESLSNLLTIYGDDPMRMRDATVIGTYVDQTIQFKLKTNHNYGTYHK